MRANGVRHLVVHLARNEDDAVEEKARVDVIGPLALPGLLDHIRNHIRLFHLLFHVRENELDDLLALLLVLRLDLFGRGDGVKDVPQANLPRRRRLGVGKDLVAILLEVAGVKARILGALRELLEIRVRRATDLALRDIEVGLLQEKLDRLVLTAGLFLADGGLLKRLADRRGPLLERLGLRLPPCRTSR